MYVLFYSIKFTCSYFLFAGDSILSVIQTPQKLSSVYGLKYKLFGIEGRAITLTSYDQWNPFCLHYSTGEAGSKVLSLSCKL